MPELPEVKTVVSKLNDNTVNSTIHGVIVNLPKLLKNISKDMIIKKLIGKKILKVTNHGKFIIFDLETHVLVSHLRMEGKYRVQEADEFGKHDHFILDLGNKYLIYNDSRQFGTIHLFDKVDYLDNPPLNKVAQEPGLIKPEELHKKISSKSIAIKATLLDQSLVAGLGNIYVNEVLWHVKINPTKKTKNVSLDELREILRVSDKILAEATKMGGTTIHSFKSFGKVEGGYQNQLKVHGKENKKCSRCGNMINKIKVGGRGTYFCPSCQKN